MANRGPAYGLSAECEQKSEAKFSAESASKCLSWIERVLGKSVGLSGGIVRNQVRLRCTILRLWVFVTYCVEFKNFPGAIHIHNLDRGETPFAG